MHAVGLDACRAGWIAVTLVDGGPCQAQVASRADQAAGTLTPRCIGVDMPVQLLDSPREADRTARRLLPGRASTVFDAPPASVVDGFDDGTLTCHRQASDLARTLAGKGISRQTWNIVAKTSEIRRLARQGEAVYEVHPEVAFATVAGAPLLSKHTPEGLTQRTAVLRRVGIELPPVPKGAKPDDLLDAAICAYVAVGIATGSSDIRQLPATGNPQPDPATPTPVVASQQRLLHQSEPAIYLRLPHT